MLQPQSISGKGETNTSTFTIWKSWLSLARSADSIFINVKHALGASGASRTSSNRRVKPEFGLHMDSTKALYQHRNRAKSLKIRGGQGRNRTADASLFRAALYQLSYLAGGELWNPHILSRGAFQRLSQRPVNCHQPRPVPGRSPPDRCQYHSYRDQARR
jgi:hypothetical protein